MDQKYFSFEYIFYLSILAEAPGAGGLKFNIQKRPMVMTNQNFTSNDQHNNNSVQQPTRMHHHMLQQQTEKSQDHW